MRLPDWVSESDAIRYRTPTPARDDFRLFKLRIHTLVTVSVRRVCMIFQKGLSGFFFPGQHAVRVIPSEVVVVPNAIERATL